MSYSRFKTDHEEEFDIAVDDLDWRKICRLLDAAQDYSLTSSERAEAEKAIVEYIRGELDDMRSETLSGAPDPDAAYDDRRQRAADLGFESIADMLFGGKR